MESGNYIKMPLHFHPRMVIERDFGHVKLMPLFSKLDMNGELRMLTSTIGKGRTDTYSNSLFNIEIKFLTIAPWSERT